MDTLKIYLKLLQKQGDEISNLYKLINDIMEMFDGIQVKNIDNLQSLITQNNNNVEKLNIRLNQMDTDIEENNKSRTHQNKLAVGEMNTTYDNEKKKNTLYKSEITRKFNKLKESVDKNIDVNNKDIETNAVNLDLLKVETDKNNINKLLEKRIKDLAEQSEHKSKEMRDYKTEMVKTITSLKNEIKIRTRQAKVVESKVKGISIK